MDLAIEKAKKAGIGWVSARGRVGILKNLTSKKSFLPILVKSDNIIAGISTSFTIFNPLPVTFVHKVVSQFYAIRLSHFYFNLWLLPSLQNSLFKNVAVAFFIIYKSNFKF